MAYLLPVSDGLFNENESGIGFEDESGHLKASYMRLRFFAIAAIILREGYASAVDRFILRRRGGEVCG